ncbi:cation-transporting P-type ATPase [Texcoconibacillus texcoconensis]|uniref:P-type Ca(2+) transporter n=1 Tax=Texcoconibacillus texcoconensis TaxID=1095777 RepID=A0A840QCC6_9BACI|nr:cation-transporting P-type ATPase [Texcoconibacillus texcoconensis]MBB5171970.1 potassium/sodium efflux P-type ATPase [Texcoconibacillus texcoconensis]
MEEKKWYHIEADDAIRHFQTNKKTGLTKEEAEGRLEKYGTNELPEGEKEPKWKKFIRHFHDVLIYILLIAAMITIFLGHYLDTTIILLVVIINATIGYIQESKAEKALDGIKKLLSSKANVVRDGKRMEIQAKDVVPGDIVVLSPGDKIPADIRLFRADNLKAEESPLTGESVPVEKGVAVLDEDTVLGDRTNMVFSGTTIASGSGLGVVISTGSYTEIGKINTSLAEVEEIKTPLLQQTAKFGKMISVFILVATVLLFIFGYFIHDYATAELLLAVIGMAVAAIPEGLPAILSIILALGVQTMARNKAIVRNLPSVETLGAVSVICSDKTGTLTKNEMTVTSVILPDRELKVTGVGYAPYGEIQDGEEEIDIKTDDTLEDFLTCVKTVNEASLEQTEDGEWVTAGEPTESCLLTLAEKANQPIPRLEGMATIPFDSSYKYMASLVEKDDGEKVIYVKGAPDRLFDMVGLKAGSEERSVWEEVMSKHAKMGRRIIGAAMKKVPQEQTNVNHEDVASGMTLLGLAGIIDPPREEAIYAVEECKKAGVTVKMITGDHKDTAVAIGKEMGIGDENSGHVQAIEGRDLDDMTEEEFHAAAKSCDIFARTSPENKLQLVQALQEEGHICAMTGDGVNDAPALKRADIGVAMGIKGTEVSKDASEMVLVDDNFKTIVNAVREGRRVYDNLKKTILFILPTNGTESFIIFASILFGAMMPLTPVQILWINMVTAVTISLAIAFEKIEQGTMERPPREPDEKLLSGYYIFRIAFVSLIAGGGILTMNADLIQSGYDQAVVNTVTLQALVMVQLFHLFNCRNERNFVFNKDFFSNKIAFLVSALLILIQLGVTYIPFMNTALGTVPIDAEYWVFPIVIGFAVFVIVEIEKWITRKVVKLKV